MRREQAEVWEVPLTVAHGEVLSTDREAEKSRPVTHRGSALERWAARPDGVE